MIEILPTSKTYLPPDLGKSAEKLLVKANTVGFLQECVAERGPHKLNQLPPSPHTAVTLLEHMQVKRVPVTSERGMTTHDITRAILYNAHSSATK